jgi:hypothetical protein
VAAQPDVAAQRLGVFRTFPVDGKQGLKVRFSTAGLDLYNFRVVIAPRGAQANVVSFLLSQPRQPGGGLGLKCFAACYGDVVLVTALEMPNNLSALRLGELEKLVISNNASFSPTSTWFKAIPLDEEPVALCCLLTAAFAASRRSPAV